MTFADGLRTWLAVSVALLLIAVLMLAFIVTFLRMRWEAERRRAARRRGFVIRRLPRAPFRRRFAAQCREILGLPWAMPGDGEPLDEYEMRVFAGCVIAEEEQWPLAPEPKRARRQP